MCLAAGESVSSPLGYNQPAGGKSSMQDVLFGGYNDTRPGGGYRVSHAPGGESLIKGLLTWGPKEEAGGNYKPK